MAYYLQNFEMELTENANLGMRFLFTLNPYEEYIVKLKIKS